MRASLRHAARLTQASGRSTTPQALLPDGRIACRLFASPITPTTQPVDLAPLAALTYASLGQLETRKKLRQVPTAIRPPQALFGRDPVNEIAGQQPLLSGLGSWR